MACSLFVSAFMANASNSIIKLAVFLFPCLKDSIFHLASAVFILLLNIVLISFTKSFQSWVPNLLSSLSSFFCMYILATPSLRWARIAVILSLVSITLLFLRKSQISLHQSSNFIQSLSNHLGSGIILFSMRAYTFLLIITGATDISVSVYLFISSKVLFVIYKDPNHSNSTSISFILLELVLVSLCSFHYICFVWQVTLSSFIYRFYPLYLSCKVSSSMLYQMLRP